MYLSLVDRGLEQFAAVDLQEQYGVRVVYVGDYHVLFESDAKDFTGCRSLLSVIDIIDKYRIASFDDIKALSLDLHGAKVRVNCTRYGVHGFKSVDVVSQLHSGLPGSVDLESPDKVIHAVIIDDAFYLGWDLGYVSKRDYRIFPHNDPIKPSIAYSLVKLSGFCEGRSFIDPFCGSGTIPIEASLLAKGKVYGTDIQSRHIRNSIKNASAAGAQVDFSVRDIRMFDSDMRFDAIVTQPPRYTKKRDNAKLMEAFFRFVDRHLQKGGKVILLHNYPVLEVGSFSVKDMQVYQGKEKRMVTVMSR